MSRENSMGAVGNDPKVDVDADGDQSFEGMERSHPKWGWVFEEDGKL